MDNVQQASGVGMMTLVMGNSVDAKYLAAAAGAIRQLPGVLRVLVSGGGEQLELMFQQPAPGLLRQIHQALQAHRQTNPHGPCPA